jgi:hypothetical protein
MRNLVSNRVRLATPEEESDGEAVNSRDNGKRKMAKETEELLKDPVALKAQLDRELQDFQNLQDAGSEEMSPGERLDLLEHRNAPRIRKKYSIPGNKAQSMHDAPQSAMRDLPNWEAGTSFTVLGESEVHSSINAGWKREFQAMGKNGPSHIPAKQLEDVVGRSINESALRPEQQVALKQRLKDELYLDYGLTEDSLVRRPYSGRASTAPATPSSGTPSGFHKVDIHCGMRLRDQQVMEDAAQENNRWIGVRYTNPESMQYIGQEGFSPKRIDCKAKTADMPGHSQAGLVADPYFHADAFQDPAAAQQRWDEMNKKLPEGYEVDEDEHSPRFRCLRYQGNYIHADYDLYDIVDPENPRANLSLATKMHGQPHYQTRNLPAVGNSINERIGTPMIKHGGEYQLQDHTNQSVMFFGPQGERLQVHGEEALRELYNKKFEGRQPPNHKHAMEEPQVTETEYRPKLRLVPASPPPRLPDSHPAAGPPPRVRGEPPSPDGGSGPNK